MIEVICFDFDGTIVDSMPFLEENAIEVLCKHIKHLSVDEARKLYRETTGLPFIQQVELISPGNPVNKKMVAQFEEMKVEKIYQQKLFPETISVLRRLKKEGFYLSISSGTIEEIILEYLSRMRISPLVDVIMGWREGFEKGKDHFEHLMKISGFSSSEILFIGDSLNDAKRAKVNKVDFVGRTGMFSKNDFNTIISDVTVFNNLEELFKFLNIL